MSNKDTSDPWETLAKIHALQQKGAVAIEAAIVCATVYLFFTSTIVANAISETNTLRSLIYAGLGVAAVATSHVRQHGSRAEPGLVYSPVCRRALSSLASFCILADIIVGVFVAFDGQPATLGSLPILAVLVPVAILMMVSSGQELGRILVARPPHSKPNKDD